LQDIKIKAFGGDHQVVQVCGSPSRAPSAASKTRPCSWSRASTTRDFRQFSGCQALALALATAVVLCPSSLAQSQGLSSLEVYGILYHSYAGIIDNIVDLLRIFKFNRFEVCLPLAQVHVYSGIALTALY
jgi:hypothetical protein